MLPRTEMKAAHEKQEGRHLEPGLKKESVLRAEHRELGPTEREWAKPWAGEWLPTANSAGFRLTRRHA